MSRMPDFLVIGAQKSGTSSLCDVLGRHPQIFMTDPKEPYFFSHPEVWARGLEWYRDLFAGAGAARAAGEGSTTYTQHHLHPDAPARVIEHLPDARLIFIARDPLERMRSHWMHLRSRAGRESRPFTEAVRSRPEYVDNSRYDHQLSFYRDHYGPDRLLVLLFEDYRRAPDATVRRCLEFIGADPDVVPAPRESARHASDRGRVDTPATAVLRRIPGFERLRDLAPGGLRSVLRQALKQPIGERPEFDRATRAWAIEQVRDDARAFLRRYGLREDAWDLRRPDEIEDDGRSASGAARSAGGEA